MYSCEEPFQHEIRGMNFSPMEHVSKLKNSGSRENSFQCYVCNQTISLTDFKSPMLTHTTSPIQYDASRRKLSQKEQLIHQVRMHTGEKTPIWSE
ncbi:hypothetical protein TNIN_300701 [Trichonephila inaurata madagascariensis]|uniref:C2H2-type domain-containing protein n=1 Tax=Trichonephila inaurata madagascariensis TaxID=2747483 RepID=A0A8X6WQC5_9ARAC|nr:hypothetical protein TNIN_300701 [Trichonephila inaurata madagascariensis]